MELEKCAVCGEPLFKSVILFGEEKLMRRQCACRRKEVEEENAYTESMRVFNKARQILEDGYLDKAYANYTFASVDDKESKAAKDMKQYADSFDKALKVNKGIYLYGNAGVGKTFYASCIANELRKRGQYVLIGSASDYVRYFTKNYGRNEDAESQIRTYPLMIIDDIGVERVNDNSMGVMNEIIDMRYLSKKPLICTSNFAPNKLYEGTGAYGERITSRLAEMCVAYPIKGKDRRRA